MCRQQLKQLNLSHFISFLSYALVEHNKYLSVIFGKFSVIFPDINRNA